MIRSLKSTQDLTLETFQPSIQDLNSFQTFSHHDRSHHVPENVEALIYPFLNHFESQALPQSRQSSQALKELLISLRPFSQIGVDHRSNGLTKAERLQICDLAPTQDVEIYLVSFFSSLQPLSFSFFFPYLTLVMVGSVEIQIIEECDLRFTVDEIEEILNLVRRHLSNESRVTSTSSASKLNGTSSFDQMVNGIGADYEDDEMEPNLGDIDDDDALVAEAREGGLAADQELDEVPD